MVMSSEIVKTIYQQLMTLGKIIVWSWGAHNWTEINPTTLQFTVDGALFSGHVRIEYDEGLDLYNIHYGFFVLGKWVNIKTEEGIYFDMLIEQIDVFVETLIVH
jgi:hypothetical protein